MGDRGRWSRQSRPALRPCHRLRDRSSLSDAGQAAVEFALCLPLVVVLVLGLVQVALVARDQLAIELAAREGARAAAVSSAPETAARAAVDRAISIRPVGVDVAVGTSTVTVTVRTVNRTDVAIIGRAIGDADLSATVTMALEPP